VLLSLLISTRKWFEKEEYGTDFVRDLEDCDGWKGPEEYDSIEILPYEPLPGDGERYLA
jgi:hypothetical protein